MDGRPEAGSETLAGALEAAVEQVESEERTTGPRHDQRRPPA